MPKFTRRRILSLTAQSAAAAAMAGCSNQTRPRTPSIGVNRPQLPAGVSSGDITPNSAIIWSQSDRPARMFVEWSTTESFRESQSVQGPDALPINDLTARLDLQDLPPNQRIFYRASFMDLANPKVMSEPQTGTFKTAPLTPHDIHLAWSGDTCGQGWGINPAWGGLKIYEQIRALAPDFFIHSGDTIYADQPILPEVKLPDGSLWKNLTSQAKSHVAQTLADFRGNYAYNLLDETLRRFNASIPILYQWDDHEVKNNWYPGQILDDPLYTVKDVNTLASRARQAFLDYTPIRDNPSEKGRIYRSFSFGPLLDVFMLDQRTYRGKNNANNQTTLSAESAFMGQQQVDWLKQSLLKSQATWKLIASDMPLSTVVKDGKNFEAVAQGDKGAPLGRELEIAGLLSFCKQNNIRNLVWITTDVHHALALEYLPEKAAFHDFDPFWEFITGPLHAGSFGPDAIDPTFGPQIRFRMAPPKPGVGPWAGYQFFGTIEIDAKSQGLRLTQHKLGGEKVYSTELLPVL
jgi:alkaline phosphatase D